jgi:RimJ/RimL family protein N-acetyltransferase
MRLAGSGENNEVVFHDFTNWEEIPNEIKMSLVMADGRQEEGFENVIKRGWRLWIGTVGNQFAIFIWTRTSYHSADFLFPIGEKAVLIWYGESIATYRGMGLMPLLVDHIVQTLDAEGIQTAFVTCATFNLATRRVLEKAYFRVIGRGLMRAGSGRGILWIPSKMLQEGKAAS